MQHQGPTTRTEEMIQVCGRIFWSLVVNSFKEAVGLRLASTPICELEMSGLLTIKLCIEPETAYWVCIIHVN
jgi:hypothetical protein